MMFGHLLYLWSRKFIEKHGNHYITFLQSPPPQSHPIRLSCKHWVRLSAFLTPRWTIVKDFHRRNNDLLSGGRRLLIGVL
ncbi:hypothetical protein GDO81_022940 [Engystomops pustulosus]|uniref:Uncharacterized protein n=1 Tax=Engystomops pustulosus TaxID=76066 RepID=A0AAV6Z7R8_ENGPU|nr:hypothetical protein GDO81_022940 [Engystomops pustulosus]